MMFEDEYFKSGLKQIAIEVLEDDDRRANRKFALQQVRDEVEGIGAGFRISSSSKSFLATASVAESAQSHSPSFFPNFNG